MEDLNIYCHVSGIENINVLINCSYDDGPQEQCNYSIATINKYLSHLYMPHNAGGLNITIDSARFLPGSHKIDIIFFHENISPTSVAAFNFTVEGI